VALLNNKNIKNGHSSNCLPIFSAQKCAIYAGFYLFWEKRTIFAPEKTEKSQLYLFKIVDSHKLQTVEFQFI
jgi:hypothetical protein